MMYWLCKSSPRYRSVSDDKSFVCWLDDCCSVCGRNLGHIEYNSPIHYFKLYDRGKIFPDFLEYHGRGERWLVLSKRALEVFAAEGISGIQDTEQVVIVDDYPDMPEYYIVHVSGRIDYSFKRMFLKKKKICVACGQFDWNRQRHYPVYLDLNTWNGEDICLLTSSTGVKLCSEKVKKVVKKHKLTGFGFEEFQTVSDE